MQIRIGGFILAVCATILLGGCQSADKQQDERTPYSLKDDTAIKLRLNAPNSVQSILVEANALDVDTTGFSSSFNILNTRKVIYSKDFGSIDDVLVAIQPGRVQVNVYAFANEISVLGDADLNQANYFGKTDPFQVGVGEEKFVDVNMRKSVNVKIADLRITGKSGNFILQLQTDSVLPANTQLTVLYNDENPDFLNFAEKNNRKETFTIQGSNHSLNLNSANLTPYFVKVSVSYQDDKAVYRGDGNAFCTSSVCGDLPNAIYERKIASLDSTNLSTGIKIAWKTTNKSGSSIYFSKNFFDQISLTKAITSGYDLTSLNIFSLNQTIFYDPAKPTEICSAGACATIAKNDLLATSNAPANFLDDVKVLITSQVTQNLTDFAFFANTADCTESLSRLGQDCSRIPRVNSFFIENDQLYLDIFLGNDSKLNIYPASNGLKGGATTTIPLTFANADSSGKTAARTQGIDLRSLASTTGNYFGQVSNAEFQGSILNLNIQTWLDHSGIEKALKTLPTLDNVATIKARTTQYFSLDLVASKSYTISIEGLKGAANFFEVLLIAPDQKTIVKSMADPLLGSGVIEKNSLTVTPSQSGSYILKVANPIATDLYFILSVQ